MWLTAHITPARKYVAKYMLPIPFVNILDTSILLNESLTRTCRSSFVYTKSIQKEKARGGKLDLTTHISAKYPSQHTRCDIVFFT